MLRKPPSWQLQPLGRLRQLGAHLANFHSARPECSPSAATSSSSTPPVFKRIWVPQEHGVQSQQENLKEETLQPQGPRKPWQQWDLQASHPGWLASSPVLMEAESSWSLPCWNRTWPATVQSMQQQLQQQWQQEPNGPGQSRPASSRARHVGKPTFWALHEQLSTQLPPLPHNQHQLALKLQDLTLEEGLSLPELEQLLAADLDLRHGGRNLRLGLSFTLPPRRRRALPPPLLLCAYQTAFRSNLLYLRQYLGSSSSASCSGGSRLSAVGELLVRWPRHMACFLALPGDHVRALDLAIRQAGYSSADIEEMLQNNIPPLLAYQPTPLPLYRQKLEWLRQETPYKLGHMVLLKGCLASSLTRMSSRLAFMRHLGLQEPVGMTLLSNPDDKGFCHRLRQRMGWEPVEVEEFHRFVKSWLQTPEGRRWSQLPPDAC
ncbi:hypothetical protein N2152v2_007666 [Parachlorella kessleri]